MNPPVAHPPFADDVRRGLLSSPKQLQPLYLYDALGSQLFEAICRLPWYPLTRAEASLLDRHAAAMTAHFGGELALIELGCGSGEKLMQICRPLRERGVAPRVHLVDISQAALDQAAALVAPLCAELTAHRATYAEGLAQAAERRAPGAPAVVLFLGSNIGNLDPDSALAMLRAVRRALRAGDALLLGADLVKPREDLLRAYDDPLGVTAAFNKNLLVRINRELGADFELAAFAHEARWNEGASRVEMHLVSRRPQRVRVPGAGLEISFAEGETIWTESSHKYTPEGIAALAALAGLRCREQWIEPAARFSTSLLEVDA